MDRKLEDLIEVSKKLKSEFFGLDNIIDSLIDYITPWYLNSEILERPLVISLWGITGTGKTSLIKRLIKYLDLSNKSTFIDCGEYSKDSNLDNANFFERLRELSSNSAQILENDTRFSEEEIKEIGLNLDEYKISDNDSINCVFVFDEFQYMNTLDPISLEENSNSKGRSIWNLIDSGIIDVNSSDYTKKNLRNYLDEISLFSSLHKNIKLENGVLPVELTEKLSKQLSYFKWGHNDYDEFGEPVEDKEGESKKQGLKILYNDEFSYMVRELNQLRRSLGFEFSEKLMNCTTLEEAVECLRIHIGFLSKPDIINCSKSLIFILGNLDEAFEVSSEYDPDIDADIYHNITSKVTIMDIKETLKKRFRNEQVGRIGNNIIIYPSLKKSDLYRFIDKELARILTQFNKKHPQTIIVTDKFKQLLYSEGCYPTQGCRPLISTINNIFSPILSEIARSNENTVIVDVKEDSFNVPEATIILRTDDKHILEKKISLNLGSIRSPERCKKLGLQAIHEASHAIVSYCLKGKLPSVIVASNVFGNGGYMLGEIEHNYSVDSVNDMKIDTMISLAGYFGEREFFLPEKCSLGSSSDIRTVWDNLSSAFYDCGLYSPIAFTTDSVCMNTGIPFGLDDNEIKLKIKELFEELCCKTKKLISEHRELIRTVAKYLVKHRSMDSETLRNVINEYEKPIEVVSDDEYYNNF